MIPREPENPIGYFSCSHTTKMEFTKESQRIHPQSKGIQRKVQPIGSQLTAGTETESMVGHWNKAVRRTPKDGFRQKFPSPRKGENLKPPKLNKKRILDVIPSSGLDTVCGARKKKGREKTSFPPASNPQKKNQYGQWDRRKKKSRSFDEDQRNNGFGQLGNGWKIQWKSRKIKNSFSGECAAVASVLVS